MRERRPASILLTVAVVSCVGAPTVEPDPCEWSAQGTIHLTGHDANDTVSVSVYGPSCGDAFLRLGISAPDRSPIYRFEAPLAVFFSAVADPSSVPEGSPPESVRRFVDELARAQEPRTVAALPSWAPGEVDAGTRFHQHLLPQADFARLANQPVFHHPAGWEFGFELAFDPRAGAVVRVMESWR